MLRNEHCWFTMCMHGGFFYSLAERRIPNEQLHLAWPAATIPTTCTPGHAPPPHPQASAAICNLHPAGSFASQQPPKRASPQEARPSHALSSLQPSGPITHLAPAVAPSTTFIPATFTPHRRGPGRNRYPTVTQLPPGTSASKSTAMATLIRCRIASKSSTFSATPPQDPLFSLRSQWATTPCLTAGFRNIYIYMHA